MDCAEEAWEVTVAVSAAGRVVLSVAVLNPRSARGLSLSARMDAEGGRGDIVMGETLNSTFPALRSGCSKRTTWQTGFGGAGGIISSKLPTSAALCGHDPKCPTRMTRTSVPTA